MSAVEFYQIDLMQEADAGQMGRASQTTVEERKRRLPSLTQAENSQYVYILIELWSKFHFDFGIQS